MLPKASPKSLRPAKPFRMPPRSAGASPTRAQEQRAASEDRLQQLNVLDRDLPLVGEEVGCGGSVYGDRKTLVCDQGCVAGGPALTTVRRVPRPHTPDHTTGISGLNITLPPQPTPSPARNLPRPFDRRRRGWRGIDTDHRPCALRVGAIVLRSRCIYNAFGFPGGARGGEAREREWEPSYILLTAQEHASGRPAPAVKLRACSP